jgi:hypothetical protein
LRFQFAGDAFRLLAALRIHDGDMCALLASAWQMRCPSPPLPPVTSATLPFRSIASIPSCKCAVLAEDKSRYNFHWSTEIAKAIAQADG